MRVLGLDLVPIVWLLWMAYWIISAWGNKSVVRRESPLSRLTHGRPVMIGIGLLTIHGNGILSTRWMAGSVQIDWLGVALVLAGLGFTVWARVHLAGNWSGTVTLKEGHSLTRSGPYGWVRHPIYSGLLLAILGSAITDKTIAGLVGLLLIAGAFLWKIHVEELFLRARFGDAYARYAADVPALIPWPRP